MTGQGLGTETQTLKAASGRGLALAVWRQERRGYGVVHHGLGSRVLQLREPQRRPGPSEDARCYFWGR